jgi:geranylgeranyl diphosphate synthase, type II
MEFAAATIPDGPADGIKHVPQDAAVRQAVRAAATLLADGLDHGRPLLREDLERHAERLLGRLGLPRQFLGFAMVAISNEFWRPSLEGIAFDRRLFLLPHCLSNRVACQGKYDSVGLHCAGCGSCGIADLQREAERLGYGVIVAEGTSSVLMKILEGEADAVIGVACLDSLEKSFQRVVELGVPHMALPLLRDGCLNTQAEVGQIRRLLRARTTDRRAAPRSYIPLLRETTRMFQQPLFGELLLPYEPAADDGLLPEDGLATGPRIALDWLRQGGKRLRPFVTVAAYAVARYGAAALDAGSPIGDRLAPANPPPALGLEAFPKAPPVPHDI